MLEFFKTKDLWLSNCALGKSKALRWLFRVSTETEMPVKSLFSQELPQPLRLCHFICLEGSGTSLRFCGVT